MACDATEAEAQVCGDVALTFPQTPVICQRDASEHEDDGGQLFHDGSLGSFSTMDPPEICSPGKVPRHVTPAESPTTLPAESPKPGLATAEEALSILISDLALPLPRMGQFAAPPNAAGMPCLAATVIEKDAAFEKAATETDCLAAQSMATRAPANPRGSLKTVPYPSQHQARTVFRSPIAQIAPCSTRSRVAGRPPPSTCGGGSQEGPTRSNSVGNLSEEDGSSIGGTSAATTVRSSGCGSITPGIDAGARLTAGGRLAQNPATQPPRGSRPMVVSAKASCINRKGRSVSVHSLDAEAFAARYSIGMPPAAQRHRQRATVQPRVVVARDEFGRDCLTEVVETRRGEPGETPPSADLKVQNSGKAGKKIHDRIDARTGASSVPSPAQVQRGQRQRPSASPPRSPLLSAQSRWRDDGTRASLNAKRELELQLDAKDREIAQLKDQLHQRNFRLKLLEQQTNDPNINTGSLQTAPGTGASHDAPEPPSVKAALRGRNRTVSPPKATIPRTRTSLSPRPSLQRASVGNVHPKFPKTAKPVSVIAVPVPAPFKAETQIAGAVVDPADAAAGGNGETERTRGTSKTRKRASGAMASQLSFDGTRNSIVMVAAAVDAEVCKAAQVAGEKRAASTSKDATECISGASVASMASTDSLPGSSFTVAASSMSPASGPPSAGTQTTAVRMRTPCFGVSSGVCSGSAQPKSGLNTGPHAAVATSNAAGVNAILSQVRAVAAHVASHRSPLSGAPLSDIEEERERSTRMLHQFPTGMTNGASSSSPVPGQCAGIAAIAATCGSQSRVAQGSSSALSGKNNVSISSPPSSASIRGGGANRLFPSPATSTRSSPSAQTRQARALTTTQSGANSRSTTPPLAAPSVPAPDTNSSVAPESAHCAALQGGGGQSISVPPSRIATHPMVRKTSPVTIHRHYSAAHLHYPESVSSAAGAPPPVASGNAAVRAVLLSSASVPALHPPQLRPALALAPHYKGSGLRTISHAELK